MTETLELLDRLVAFPTVSADSNLPLIDFVQDHLAARGFAVHRIPDVTGNKAGLFASMGPAGPGGVMLSAHSDVVPVDGQTWTSDPFRLHRDGGRAYGRGAADMKGFLAAALALANRVREEDLNEPLKLAISFDEEVGCMGIPQMLPHLATMIGTPRLCIVGEPTSMRVATGHKGKAVFRVTCRGDAGHSSMAPNHVNALHLAADVVLAIRRLQREVTESGAHDAGYEIPYTTLHVGRMNGGTALNIVPDRAVLDLEYRHVAGDPQADLDARLTQAVQSAETGPLPNAQGGGVILERVGGYPGLEVSQSAPCVEEVSGLAGDLGTIKVGYGTEAGYFSGIGIPTVICGPGSMAQGHVPDEYIELGQLAQCDAMLERLRSHLGAGRTFGPTS